MNLYDHAGEFKRAEQELNELLYSDEIAEEVVTDTLDALMLGFEERANEVAKMILNEQAFEASVNVEINRLKDKQIASRRKVKRLKEYLITAMQEVGTHKIKSSIATYYIRKNQGSVKIKNEELVPSHFKTTKTEEVIDKRELKAAIEKGEVPEFVATIEHSKSLIIK